LNVEQKLSSDKPAISDHVHLAAPVLPKGPPPILDPPAVLQEEGITATTTAPVVTPTSSPIVSTSESAGVEDPSSIAIENEPSEEVALASQNDAKEIENTSESFDVLEGVERKKLLQALEAPEPKLDGEELLDLDINLVIKEHERAINSSRPLPSLESLPEPKLPQTGDHVKCTVSLQEVQAKLTGIADEHKLVSDELTAVQDILAASKSVVCPPPFVCNFQNDQVTVLEDQLARLKAENSGLEESLSELHGQLQSEKSLLAEAISKGDVLQQRASSKTRELEAIQSTFTDTTGRLDNVMTNLVREKQRLQNLQETKLVLEAELNELRNTSLLLLFNQQLQVYLEPMILFVVTSAAPVVGAIRDFVGGIWLNYLHEHWNAHVQPLVDRTVGPYWAPVREYLGLLFIVLRFCYRFR
jgi:hypothetical protein